MNIANERLLYYRSLESITSVHIKDIGTKRIGTILIGGQNLSEQNLLADKTYRDRPIAIGFVRR
jgi:hypothetical protein